MATRKTATKTKSAARKPVKSASHKAKSSTSKAGAAASPRKAGQREVTMDRRHAAGRRGSDETGEARETVVAPVRLERRKKVNRRRQIDPTTCERDYTEEEIQFMNALDDYKRSSGRMFPTCSEVLEVVRSLGYVRLSPNEVAAYVPAQPAAVMAEVEPDDMTNENE